MPAWITRTVINLVALLLIGAAIKRIKPRVAEIIMRGVAVLAAAVVALAIYGVIWVIFWPLLEDGLASIWGWLAVVVLFLSATALGWVFKGAYEPEYDPWYWRDKRIMRASGYFGLLLISLLVALVWSV